MRSVFLLAASFSALSTWTNALSFEARAPRCRVQPGDREFPSQTDWNRLNEEVGGRLVAVVPSAKFCHDLPSGNCTLDQWSSSNFMVTNPGTMLSVRGSLLCQFVHLIEFKLYPSCRLTGNRYAASNPLLSDCKC
jgi:hypothetical protein